MLARLFAFAAILLFAALPASAEGPTAEESANFQRIITGQIEAFKADDGAAAYSFAAPLLQQVFQQPETFLEMVKKGYPQVYRQKSYRFEESLADPVGRPAQKVRFIDLQGKNWIALYSMEKQADGTWRISGCYILPAPGVDA